jgi:hypothetical protein
MAKLDDNGVPILDVSGDTLLAVMGPVRLPRHPAQTDFLLGERVTLDNPEPVGADEAGVTEFVIGAETLNEAAKSVVGAFDSAHGAVPPEWVASSHDGLGKVLAEHYNIELREQA